MPLTDADKAVIEAKGATARHAKSAHLWKKAVLLRAHEMKRATPRNKAKSNTPDMFEVRA